MLAGQGCVRLIEAGLCLRREHRRSASLVEGADLYAFVSNDKPTQPASLNGRGNYLNDGIRKMLSSDYLYLGAANRMNLATEFDSRQGAEWRHGRHSGKPCLGTDSLLAPPERR